MLQEEWHLVGRSEVLRAATAALRRGTVVLAGPRGSGRSRLGEELLRAVAGTHVPTRKLTATLAARSRGPSALQSLILDGVPGGLTVMVDDAHLLGDGDAACLLQLVSEQRLRAVVTTVVGAGASDAVTALWKDGYARRFDLTLLDADVLGELLDQSLPGGVDGWTRLALVELAGGSPMALREVLADAEAAGQLEHDGRVWRLTGAIRPGGRLTDLAVALLEGLGEAELAALDLLSLADPVAVALLGRLEPDADLEVLEARSLVTTSAAGQRLEVRLTGPLIREILRSRLTPLRTRRILGRLAEATEATGVRRDGDAEALAVLLLEAGRRAAPELFLAAAVRSSGASAAPALSLRLARAAWSSGGQPEAGQVLGRLLALEGCHEEAETVMAEAMGRASGHCLVRLATARATNLLRGLHDPERARQVFELATASVTEQDDRDFLDAHQGGIDYLRGDVRGALVRLAGHLDRDDLVLAEAAVAGSPALALSGRTDEAIALARRAHLTQEALHHSGFSEEEPVVHLLSLATALFYGGQLVAASELATRCHRSALEAGSVSGAAWFALVLGNAEHARGRLRRAVASLADAADSFERLREDGLRRVALSYLALAAAEGGDAGTAAQAIEEAHDLRHAQLRCYDTALEQAQAWLASLTGKPDPQPVAEAAGADVEQGRIALAVAAAHDLARLGCPDAGTAVALQLPPVDGLVLPVRLAHVRAATAADPDALEEVAARFAACGADLAAAEALGAAAAHRGGRQQAALRCRVQELVARCDGARLDRVLPSGAPLRLTTREAEVVGLAAAGKGNGDIADALTLSVRTVENHLGRAYAKLGVTSRNELVGALSTGTAKVE